VHLFVVTVGMLSFGSQMWDQAFPIQTILASGLIEKYAATLRKAHDFVEASQALQEKLPTVTKFVTEKINNCDENSDIVTKFVTENGSSQFHCHKFDYDGIFVTDIPCHNSL